VGKAEGRRLDVGGKVVLRCILEKYDVAVLTGFIWLRIWTGDWFL
jgi:hypothetical protein